MICGDNYFGENLDQATDTILETVSYTHLDVYKRQTVNGALAALNGFFKYCDWQDCRARFLKISKNTFYPESRELSKKEYLRLVRTAAVQGNERLALLLETICSSGIRVSELPFITVAALHKGLSLIHILVTVSSLIRRDGGR